MHENQERKRCEALDLNDAGNVVVLDEKNPHIRNIRDGTVIKLDVNNGVCTMDMWICFDEIGPVFSWLVARVSQTNL